MMVERLAREVRASAIPGESTNTLCCVEACWRTLCQQITLWVLL